MRSIPFFDYPSLYSHDRANLSSVISKVCERGAFILQSELTEFERRLAEYAGCEFAIGVADGTIAITLALLASGLKKGDEVIISSHTFIATASAIVNAGGIPVPVECAEDRLIDASAVEGAITPRTRAIVPTHLNGRVCNMDKLRTIASQYDLFIVEDAAQALGAKFKGQAGGTFGTAGTISFYPAKSLGCFGDGGAVLTNDSKINNTVRSLRDHGRNASGEIERWGFNARLDNLQAAILDYKLTSFPEVIKLRRAIASLYTDRLIGVTQLALPPAPSLTGNHFDTFQNFEIEADRRDELQKFLRAEGVGTLIQWGGKAIHQHKSLGFNIELPFTEKFFSRCLMLPMNPSLGEDDIHYISDKIEKFYSKD